MKTRILLLTFITLSLFWTCKKDNQNNGNESDLMTNSIEYEGDYPEPALVNFNDNNSPKRIKAFPGQVIAFFDLSTSEQDAVQLITDNGGSILSQIPSVGYYLIEVSTLQWSSFITTFQNSALINVVGPNVPVYMKSKVTLMDDCGQEHAEAVLTTLEACGGSFDKCVDIMGDDGLGAASKIIHGIINKANENKGGTTLINISLNGGLNNNEDFDLQTDLKQFEGWNGWFWSMYSLLNAVSFLPEQYRENLVITVAAGNEHMPLIDILEKLRERAGITEILEKNIIIVSTERNNNFGNYDYTDPDVVVMNNNNAVLGTSFAAPCVMGIIDSWNSAGISAADALKAVKLASTLNAGRYVIPSEVDNLVDLINTHTEYKGNVTVFAFEVVNGPCVGMITFNTTPSIFWNGTQGSMISPASCAVTLVSGDGCIIIGNPNDSQVFQLSLTGSNSSITGQGMTLFNIGPDNFPINASFTGAVNILGDISGTFSITAVGVQSKTITLFKQ
ncbi:MAG: hypothetical protein WC599_11890 [Bacteroidales bacterium]